MHIKKSKKTAIGVGVKNTLWKFYDNSGSFSSKTADHIKNLYFPLCNTSPFMSSITPELKGDIKTGFNSFLMEPVSRIKLANSKISRNFWIYINSKKIWSATGVSKNVTPARSDEYQLDAGPLWQKITRVNKKIGLKAATTSFVPSTGEPIEIMFVELQNITKKNIKIIPTAAIPIYARSANNLHDHRQVTSLLSRTEVAKPGIIVTPTLLFDESGHKVNPYSYFVLGIDSKNNYPQHIYPTQEEFTGNSSDLEEPEVIIKNLLPDKKLNPQGKEPMAALRFHPVSLKAKESASFIIILGITTNKTEIDPIFKKFNSEAKILSALNTTKTYWQEKTYNNSIDSRNPKFDNWLRWVNIQPILRKIFGCSFLPDFDYGKGGRGWRDLWQDCLSLILSSPLEVRSILVNNFRGVRIDGSNATIIGSKSGEFIADRNNISRVWMDHGIWPLITTELYIDQTHDSKLLLERVSYFKDHHISRCREKDWDWKPEYGKELKTKNNDIYQGTILEHILVENLVQFFNVGPHNHIRLEGADWNDGLDMAFEFGESVAFTAMYAQNLNTLCGILEKLNLPSVSLLKEISILLDSISQGPIDYSDINQKLSVLQKYFNAVATEISGEKIEVSTKELICDLKKKANWILNHIQKDEWLKAGFFNGYYDNNKERVEGRINSSVRMTLTGQVFPVMSGVATREQTKELFKNAKKYLQDPKLAGFRLNTDFKSQQPALGRAFSFVYGEKENGAFFNHMAVMFAYALYKQGFVNEGFEVLNSIYKMAVNTQKSKIFPCLPEYFNGQGQGMYSYLTGSASWFMLTILTQMFGIKGNWGDLVIEPKLNSQQFKTDRIIINTIFAERKLKISFINKNKKNYGEYLISRISINGKVFCLDVNQPNFVIKREDFLQVVNDPLNTIEIELE